MTNSNTRPSERQAKHDILLEERRKKLENIAARILDAETRADGARVKFEAAGGVISDESDVTGAIGSGGCEGWASYLDEQSGLYYWFNDQTGEAYYDDSGAGWKVIPVPLRIENVFFCLSSSISPPTGIGHHLQTFKIFIYITELFYYSSS